MSLDVYLTEETKSGHQVEMYWANITHNLSGMADEAGIYQHVWRPEELGVKTASKLIAPLQSGIKLMKSNPSRFEKLNASNGWGTYDQFLPWLEKYLEACKEYPESTVYVSR